MKTYAAKCPHCKHAQAVQIERPADYTMRCRRCGRSTKYVQYSKESGLPFNAFLIKGPFERDVAPKAVAAWNLRTFGPGSTPTERPLDTLDSYIE